MSEHDWNDDPRWNAIEARLRAAFEPPADPARTVRRHWRDGESDRRSALWSLAGVAAAMLCVVTLVRDAARALPGPSIDEVYASLSQDLFLCSPLADTEGLDLEPVFGVGCGLPSGPRLFGDFPLGATHDERYAIEGPLEGLPWAGSHAVRVVGPDGIAYVITDPPASVVEHGAQTPGLTVQSCSIDGHPVIELRREEATSCLPVFVPRDTKLHELPLLPGSSLDVIGRD